MNFQEDYHAQKSGELQYKKELQIVQDYHSNLVSDAANGLILQLNPVEAAGPCYG